MENWIAALVSVIVISLASLIGIIFLGMKKNLEQKTMICMVSFAAATMLANACFHFLPEIIEHHHDMDEHVIGLWIFFGVAIGFITEKILNWNHCHQATCASHPHTFAKMNLVGDFVHNMIDGMVIGASFLVSIPAGIATSLAILLHEIPQEIGDYAVLVHGGYSKKKALLLNFLTALSAILGVVAVLLIGHWAHDLQLILIPISFGMFMYIAGADLIPQLNKHNDDRKFSMLQVLIFLTGAGLMYFLSLVGGHSH